MYRIGQGLDVHKFGGEGPVILCGVKIPHGKGLLGHSDADVPVHAVMDSVLGALALGDIGKWFPDTDPAYEGADSMILLEKLLSSPEAASWRLVNLDVTVIAERPKIASYADAMRSKLAKAFGVETSTVSVKATTTEKLGFCGREEGIASSAVILLEKIT